MKFQLVGNECVYRMKTKIVGGKQSNRSKNFALFVVLSSTAAIHEQFLYNVIAIPIYNIERYKGKRKRLSRQTRPGKWVIRKRKENVNVATLRKTSKKRNQTTRTTNTQLIISDHFGEYGVCDANCENILFETMLVSMKIFSSQLETETTWC